MPADEPAEPTEVQPVGRPLDPPRRDGAGARRPSPRHVRVRRTGTQPLPPLFADLLSVPGPPPRVRRSRSAAGRAFCLVAALGCALAVAALTLRRLYDGRSGPIPVALATDGTTAVSGRPPDAPPPSLPSAAADGDPAVVASIGLPPARRAAPLRQRGPLEVRLVSAAVQRASTIEASDAPRLVLALHVHNASTSRTVLYRPWSAGRGGSLVDRPALRDDSGNVHRPVPLHHGSEAPELGGVLRPGEAATDVLAFTRPAEPFNYLELELPTSNIGDETGTLTLRIPADSLSR